MTPLHHAISKFNPRLVRYLVEKGADISLGMSCYKGALEFARDRIAWNDLERQEALHEIIAFLEGLRRH